MFKIRHKYELVYYKVKSSTSLLIPLINCFSINPNAEAAQCHVASFLSENGEPPEWLPSEKIILPEKMYEQVYKANLMSLDALLFARSSLRELFFLELFIIYLFAHDDIVENEESTLADIEITNKKHLALLARPEIHETIKINFEDHLSRFCAYLGKNFFAQDKEKYILFFETLEKNYYQGCIDQKTTLSQQPSIFSEEQFISSRRATGGVLEVLLLSIASNNIYFNAIELEGIKEIFDTANDIIIFTNDFFSYEKEKESINACYANFIVYKQKFEGLSCENAKTSVLKVIDEKCKKFISLSINAKYTETQYLTIQILAEMIGANLHWSLFTERYDFTHSTLTRAVNYIAQLKDQFIRPEDLNQEAEVTIDATHSQQTIAGFFTHIQGVTTLANDSVTPK